MTRTSYRARQLATRRRRTALVGAALLATSLSLSSCGAISAIKKGYDSAKAADKIVNSFTATVQKSQNTTYEVTYETTGSSPSTIEYAAQPPKNYNFATTSTGGSPEDIVGNSTGQFACNESGSAWSCLKLGTADAATYQDLAQIYTGKYWLDFLKPYAVAAGLVGFSVESSSTTINGFAMSCVTITGNAQNPGSTKLCTTSQGILGYVKSQGDTSAFEIKSFTTSPPSSLFALPAGATITTIPTGSSIPTSSDSTSSVPSGT